MNLKAALFAGLLALVSWPAAALDLNAMTDEERQLFRAGSPDRGDLGPGGAPATGPDQW